MQNLMLRLQKIRDDTGIPKLKLISVEQTRHGFSLILYDPAVNKWYIYSEETT
jgi:hypothetical protein